MNNGKQQEQATRVGFFKRIVMAVPKSISAHNNNHLIPSFLVIKKETVWKVSEKVMNPGINHREP